MSYLLLAGGATSTVSGWRPIVGGLRVTPIDPKDPQYPDMRWYPVSDDTGLRSLMVNTNFCALRDMDDGFPHWESDLDDTVRAGYHAQIQYRALGFDGGVDGGHFAGRGVDPKRTPETLPKMAAACEARGLGLILSYGHKNPTQQQRMNEERAWMEALHAHGLDAVVKMVIGDNEGWQNSDFGYNGPEQFATYKAIAEMMRGILNPCPIWADGAPQSEATDELLKVANPWAQAVSVHVARDRDKFTRHTFNCVYDDNKWRIHKLYSFDEPTPPSPGPEDFMGTRAYGAMIAQGALGKMTGGLHAYFDGDDVRGVGPIAAHPMFWLVPKFLSHIPQNVSLSKRIPNAKIWWWEWPDGRLATAFDEIWDPEKVEEWLTVPLGVRLGTWVAYGPFASTIEGHGNDLYGQIAVAHPGYGGALLIAERA